MTTFLLSPDSFKNSLSSTEIVDILQQTIDKFNKNFNTSYDYIKQPLSDGGEGFLDVITQSIGGKRVKCLVHNYKFQKIETEYLINNNIAYIESAKIIGINYFKEITPNPLNYSSFGIGELIKKILENRNIDKIIIGVGGTRTVDLGLGILEALNILHFYNNNNQLIEHITPNKWRDIKKIEFNNYDNLPEIEIYCDVNNNLLGKNGGLEIYSPQKGVNKNIINDFILEAKDIVHTLEEITQSKNFYNNKHSGAAGGISWGLSLLNNTNLYSGIDKILEITNFINKIKTSDFIITGEGKTDKQSKFNKVVGRIEKLSEENKIKLIILSGIIDKNYITKFPTFSICNAPMSLEQAILNSKELLINRFFEILKFIHLFNEV